VNEQTPDFESEKTPAESAPPGELRRDRKALRETARSESPKRKPLFARGPSQPEKAEPAPSTPASDDAEFSADAEFSPFAALNLDTSSFEAAPVQPEAEEPTSALPALDPPAFEPPPYEAPTFARRTFEPPQAPTQEEAEVPKFDAAQYAPPIDWSALGRVPESIDSAEPEDPDADGGSGALDSKTHGVHQPGTTLRDPVPASGHSVLGPLRPTVREVSAELAHLDRAAIIAAVIVPPVGLVLAIVASTRGRLYRGWPSNLARAAIALSVVMMLVFALAGAYLWAQRQKVADEQDAAAAVAAAHEAVVAESVPFCSTLAASPAVFGAADPDYGWPQREDPAGYLPAIESYGALWQALVPLAPAGIAPQVQTFSERVTGIVSVASSLQSTNRAGDLLGLHQSDDIVAIANHVAEYCE
jgi:hypothetical protein